jgi:hypothetical protein
MIKVPLRAPLGESLSGERRDQDSQRRRREDHARIDCVVTGHGLEEDGDDERDPHQQRPLEILRDESEVRDPVSEQPRGSSGCLPARSWARMLRKNQIRKAAPTARNAALSTPSLSACRIPNTTR